MANRKTRDPRSTVRGGEAAKTRKARKPNAKAETGRRKLLDPKSVVRKGETKRRR